MENEQITDETATLDDYFKISFDAATRAQVRQAAVWARFYTLCAFAGYAISLIIAFFGRYMFVDNEAVEIDTSYRTGRIIGALLTTAAGVFINYFLYRFAVSTIRGIDAMDNITTNEGFNQLRRYFRILGILLIIAICLGVAGFIFGILSALNR